MSGGSGSPSGSTADQDAPDILTATFETLRANARLHVINVVQSLLRRRDQVLCLTLTREPCPNHTPSVDVISSLQNLPGLGPGPGFRYTVVGHARFGAEWREATALSEPSMVISPACREVMHLPDWTEDEHVPLEEWGPSTTDESEKQDEDLDSDDIQEDDNEDDGRSNTSVDDGNEEGNWYTDYYMLVVHPRGQETVVLSRYPKSRITPETPEHLITCKLCKAAVPRGNMSKPCVFHPGEKRLRDRPSRQLTGSDSSGQLPTPTYGGTFENSGDRLEDDDSFAAGSDSDESTGDETDVRGEFGTLQENYYWKCCGSSGEKSGCMVEVRHLSAVAEEPAWRSTWEV